MDGYLILRELCKTSLLLTYSVLLVIPVNPVISTELSTKENNFTNEGAKTSYYKSAAVLNSSAEDSAAVTAAATATSVETSPGSGTPISRTEQYQSSVRPISRVTSQLTTSHDERTDNLSLSQLQMIQTTASSSSSSKSSSARLRLHTTNGRRKSFTSRPLPKGTVNQAVSALPQGNERKPIYEKPVREPPTTYQLTTPTLPSADNETSAEFQLTTEPSIKRRHVEDEAKLKTSNSSKTNSSEEDDVYEDYYDDYEDYKSGDWRGYYEDDNYNDDYYSNEDVQSADNYDNNNKRSQESQIFNYSEEWNNEYAGNHKTFVISDIHLMPRHRDTEMRRLSISLPQDDHMNTSMLVIYIWLGLLAIMIAITFAVYKYKEQLNIIWWRVTHVCRPSPPHQTQADEGLLEHPLV